MSSKDSSSVSKTIRFPKKVNQQIQRESEQRGLTFSAVVLEKLANSHTVEITEGKELVRLLWNIRVELQHQDVSDSDRKEIQITMNQIVNLLSQIRARYLQEG